MYMKPRYIVLILIVLALLALVYSSFGTYNGLVASREGTTAQWAQVESQYQRRFDLIPNLVEAVKGTMKQEQAVFGAIAEARTQYGGAKTISEKTQAATALDGALSRLLIVMEQYPELRSIDTVTTLMSQLEGSENRIAVERQRFNQAAQAYNTSLQLFPTSVIARFGGFQQIEYTKANTEAQVAPKVSL